MTTVLRMTDQESGTTFHHDFSADLPDGVLLDGNTNPVVTFLNLDGTAPTVSPTTNNFLASTDLKTWQFDITVTGIALGSVFIVRVLATQSDTKPIEGNGILQVDIEEIDP